MGDRGSFDDFLRPSQTKPKPAAKSPARAVMLDVHLEGGTRRAFPYSVLMTVTLDGGRLVAEFATGTVVIEGARLEPLYRGLSQHRVRSVAVTEDGRGFNPAPGSSNSDQPIIRRIAVEGAPGETGQ